MEVYDAVRTVLAVREFQDKPVPDILVKKIVEAARLTGSSMNGQPWHFIVIQNPETLRQIGSIASSGSFIGKAPLAIAVVMENANRPELDAGRSLQQLELAAWSEGIGGCVAGIRGDPKADVPGADSARSRADNGPS